MVHQSPKEINHFIKRCLLVNNTFLHIISDKKEKYLSLYDDYFLYFFFL